MPEARTFTAVLNGVTAHLVEVETHIGGGLPATILVGLPDTALREARDRVRAAIINSAEPWPATKITVGLLPASLPKSGSLLDLAIAVAILAADGTVPAPPADRPVLFFAELGLDGKLRPVPGALPAALAAAADGIGTVVVASANAAEASHAPDVRVVPAGCLADVVAWLRGGPEPAPQDPALHASIPGSVADCGDLADVRGQDSARLAAEIWAAGAHNLSLVGPAGTGTMLAERLPGILPDLTPEEALEVTAIHSVAGMIPATGIITRPPFVAPHHTASMPAIVGGGSSQGITRPGAASLAHLGVLVLEDAPEFRREVLDALRQPMEAGEVLIARHDRIIRFPARFSLLLTARPCPCGASRSPSGNCSCTPAMRRRYLGRLSGPLTDSIDLKAAMTPTPARARRSGDSSQVVLGRVTAARDRARRRLRGTPWHVNSQVPLREVPRLFPVTPGADEVLRHAVSIGAVGERAALRALRVAWTIADLAGRDRPAADDCALALAYATGNPHAGDRLRRARRNDHASNRNVLYAGSVPRSARERHGGDLHRPRRGGRSDEHRYGRGDHRDPCCRRCRCRCRHRRAGGSQPCCATLPPGRC
jgi:magnesium chelatase family protein